MIGALYLILAVGCWTVWAVLSVRLCARLSPLNSLLWTGLVSAAITVGGFVVHHQQLRMPSRTEWWLLGGFCVANTVASFGYYAALRHLPGCLVLPVSHLYLVLGPVLLAFSERQSMTWQQFGALCLVAVGVVLFLAASPGTAPAPAEPATAPMATTAHRQEVLPPAAWGARSS
jgi:drug/metabolite transporter (DMT)-like permease